ncbi:MULTISPECIES: hypothetical protein [Rhizobium]|uniref:hypothetical protein n=1 Tax=Rhizobium TaxID=379 RepID=UPI001030ECFA|nr:hypothetical protein [Rhizobium ruizarguesonis]TBA43649.1 hypothetical protein ELH62_15285 [Rhizobium ruizarguesonis]
MANKAMALSQRQIKALCLGAAQAGFEPEITINGVLIRFVPKGTRPTQVTRTREDELDEELERFAAKHGYKL